MSKISEEKRKEFAGVFLLEYMVNESVVFPLLLKGDEECLAPILEWLLVKEYVFIQDKKEYVVSLKGQKFVESFTKRYEDYLKNFDLFCGVDLQSGEFAFDRYYDFDDDRWSAYLALERWDDLRVAVAEYKKMDPIEVVFMSTIQEGYFGRNEKGWQFDLLLGKIWDEIEEIVRTAIHYNELAYENVSSEDVMRDMLAEAQRIYKKLERIDQGL